MNNITFTTVVIFIEPAPKAINYAKMLLKVVCSYRSFLSDLKWAQISTLQRREN